MYDLSSLDVIIFYTRLLHSYDGIMTDSLQFMKIPNKFYPVTGYIYRQNNVYGKSLA